MNYITKHNLWLRGILMSIYFSWLPFLAVADLAPTQNIPHQDQLTDPTFRQIIKNYQSTSGNKWVNSMHNLLDQDVVLHHWDGKQTTPIRGVNAVSAYLNEEVNHLKNLQKNIGRFMLAGGGIGGSLTPYNSTIVLFYQASAHSTDHPSKWVWAGNDIITISHGKIIDWRIQEDTNMKFVVRPAQIHIEREYAIIDKYWQPISITNNLVGMSYLLDLKRTVMPTAERGKLLLSRMDESIEQSTWEPDNILFLQGKNTVKQLFFDGLISVLPDFYENVEQILVSGNAFIMIQNPSGTQPLSNGTNHRAWYNCDIYFFNGPNINALLFQRDTLMDIVEEAKGNKKTK